MQFGASPTWTLNSHVLLLIRHSVAGVAAGVSPSCFFPVLHRFLLHGFNSYACCLCLLVPQDFGPTLLPGPSLVGVNDETPLPIASSPLGGTTAQRSAFKHLFRTDLSECEDSEATSTIESVFAWVYLQYISFGICPALT